MKTGCHKRIRWSLLIAAGFMQTVAIPLLAASDEPDWPAWADEEEALRERAAQVNEGDLKFLVEPVDKPVHHHSSHVTISDASLTDGWVLLQQCHTHLDRVPALQIVFNAQHTRGLEVVSFENIEEVFVQDHTIQLRNVGDASQVCVRTESRALREIDEGEYDLLNGPFMRRFLDGYYPLRLTLRIDYPDSLRLAGFTPAVQAGFAPLNGPGRVEVDTLFEGRLHTRFRFFLRQRGMPP